MSTETEGEIKVEAIEPKPVSDTPGLWPVVEVSIDDLRKKYPPKE